MKGYACTAVLVLGSFLASPAVASTRVLSGYVEIPAGSFSMGSPEDEIGRAADEGPRHTVTVKRFALAITEVTRGEFARFVTAVDYVTDAERSDRGCGGPGKRAGTSWRQPGFEQSDDHPVVCVSRFDAERYATWLSETAGQRLRLPTEAEFERALRLGGDTVYPWGGDGEAGCQFGNIGDASFRAAYPKTESAARCDDGQTYTSLVGSYQSTGQGLKDLSGNVWEWTQDCFHKTFDGAPTDGSAWIDTDCPVGVLRGASFDDGPQYQRSANRVAAPPAAGAWVFGFRLVYDLPEV